MHTVNKNLASPLDRYIENQQSRFSWWDNVKYFPISLVTEPIKLIVGLFQAVLFAILTPIRGYFYKTGIKGYFIDNFVLMAGNSNGDLQEKYIAQVKKGELKNAEFSFIGNNNQFEVIKFQHPEETSKKRKWIVYVPGMGASIYTSSSTLQRIHKEGYNVICANNYEVGRSQKLTEHPHSIETLIQPVISAYRHIKEQDTDVIFWGHSMGGAIAVQAASTIDEEIDIIIDRSFSRFIDAANQVQKYIFFPFNRLLSWIVHRTLPFDTEKALYKTKGVVTILTHKDDEVIANSAAAIQCRYNKENASEGHRMRIQRYLITESDSIFAKKETPGFIDKSAKTHTGQYSRITIKKILEDWHARAKENLSRRKMESHRAVVSTVMGCTRSDIKATHIDFTAINFPTVVV